MDSYAVIGTGAAIACSMFGDALTFRMYSMLSRALMDDASHGIVAGLTWLATSSSNNIPCHIKILYAALATFFAVAIDLDHFVAARSWSLKDALNLSNRPFLHCSS